MNEFIPEREHPSDSTTERSSREDASRSGSSSFFNRSMRLVVAGGVAVGVGFGAMAMASAATSSTASPTAPPAAPSMPGKPGMFGHRMMGFGDGGTITQISGTTLTLRTEAGTETVTTSNSTKFTKERQTIHFSDLKVDDVVNVLPVAGSSSPGKPGTGTVAAGTVRVVEPVLMGRVASLDGATAHLVGRNGELLTVTVSDGTKYYSGKQTATSSILAVGNRIVAQGAQDSLTHLNANLVTILPAMKGGMRTGGLESMGLPGGGQLTGGLGL